MTSTGRKAMDAGIPVINLDREFSDPLAYRVLIKGDNYGMGVAAGHYIGQKLKDNKNAVIAEIPGIDELPLTQDRSKGFKDALSLYCGRTPGRTHPRLRRCPGRMGRSR